MGGVPHLSRLSALHQSYLPVGQGCPTTVPSAGCWGNPPGLVNLLDCHSVGYTISHMFGSSPTTTHELKLWPRWFEDVSSGKKTFEVRVNDRNFRVGDAVVFREYDPVSANYTGRRISARISYLIDLELVGRPDLVVFSITTPVSL